MAMASQIEPDFFRKAREKEQIVVKDPPKFDLDAYIANYKGKTRFDRLLLIGLSSTYLYQEALRGALDEAKQGRDVGRYQAAVSALYGIIPEGAPGVPDLAWIDRMNKQIKAETDRLELELKGYKNNLIKESIRMGYDDLGQHYHRIGDLPNSSKAFTRMRDFCTTPSHVIIMKLRMLNVAIEQRNWIAVQTNVQTIRQGGHKQAEVEKISAKLSAAAGLADLASGNYAEAAEEFLKTDPRMATAKMDDATDEESFNEAMTPNDIAVYGGLCALASMSRDDLQTKILDNASFRNYLELEPHIRRAVSFFVSGKYAACLAILNNYKPDYLLDIYLQPHVDAIYAEVRTKSIRQYFVPFSHVTLAALAAAFDTDETTITAELTTMIKKQQLDARIDLVDRVLLARKVKPRNNVQKEALDTAKRYDRTAHLRVMRMEVLNAGFEVQSKKGRPQTSNWLTPGMNDEGLGNGMVGEMFSGVGKSLRSGLRGG